MQLNKADQINNLNIAHALTWRYVIALTLVGIFSTAAWLSLHLVVAEQKSTAVVVNVSGRQRMLSQRTALFSNLLVSAPKTERSAIRSKLTDAIQLMERSHYGLTHGDKEMSLPTTMSPTIHSMYFEGPNALDQQVATYIKNVQELLLLDDDGLTSANHLLQYITQNSTNTLLAALDRMVHQYQLEGEASVDRLQKAETIFWVVTLFLLALEAALIFHPFVKHVKVIVGKLQGVTAELQLHQGQLEETVKQRTAELEIRTNALTESEEKFRLISTAANDAIVILGTEEQVIYWNPAAETIFGYEANEAIGKNMHTLLAPIRYHDEAHSGFERFTHHGVGKVIGKTIENTALHKNGEEFPIELSISAFRFHNSWHALGLIRNNTEKKKMENEIRQLAFYDPLTKLSNRRLLNDRLDLAMSSSKRSGCHLAVLFLDLDNFKPVNDTYGHEAGDLLLIEAASRLKRSVREIDTVARFGGDEFVVILSDLNTDKTAATTQSSNIAKKILSSLSEPYLLTISQKDSITIEHHCTASIGVVVFSNHQESHCAIVELADAAMYLAKESGRNSIQFYDLKD